MTIQIQSEYRATGPLLTKKWLVIIILLAAVTAGSYFAYRKAMISAAPTAPGPSPQTPVASAETPSHSNSVVVNVVHPREGDMDRTTKQPGSVQAFESVQLYAGVSGFLKAQSVDIGDRIKQGQVLAQVDVPELEKQVQRSASMVDQAKAKVTQTKARAVTARADFDAAKAAVPAPNRCSRARRPSFATVNNNSTACANWPPSRASKISSWMNTRPSAMPHTKPRSPPMRASRPPKRTSPPRPPGSKRRMPTSRGRGGSQSRPGRTRKRRKCSSSYATIVAPFDGVVTERNFFVRDFVRAANEGLHAPAFHRSAHGPHARGRPDSRSRRAVLRPRRSGRSSKSMPCPMRTSCAPRCRASPSPRIRLRDSCTSKSTCRTRTRKICNGMYGRVTIILEKSNILSASVVLRVWQVGSRQRVRLRRPRRQSGSPSGSL